MITMDYEAILKDIKPTESEKEHIDSVSYKIMKFLQNACDERKSDIDIFIAFPLDTDKKDLKRHGLDLAHECCVEFGITPQHHYASHPYVTTFLEGCEVDIVPCYAIEDGDQLKSAVDRTIRKSAG